jgi:hypothetical protein
MAVTASPTSVLTTISAYRLANPNNPLTKLAVVSTAPGSLATPSTTQGGHFSVWYDPLTNKLLLDYSSTQE